MPSLPGCETTNSLGPSITRPRSASAPTTSPPATDDTGTSSPLRCTRTSSVPRPLVTRTTSVGRSRRDSCCPSTRPSTSSVDRVDAIRTPPATTMARTRATTRAWAGRGSDGSRRRTADPLSSSATTIGRITTVGRATSPTDGCSSPTQPTLGRRAVPLCRSPAILPRPITATGRLAAHGYDEEDHQDVTIGA